ncbi:hypothetical protein CGLO_08653 [Colletotrichum gloeosporioides Cg-14]|uniref:Uncharacterized protein n=1 Tax=Colletotrichum gloeosporioides (strain Cg-14) TaxID=1237896 RepID=T0K8B7_COLGC|nr:hypothetical protein CGLO_08653 [Colletotrichum gloeosporioides Cg-14]
MSAEGNYTQLSNVANDDDIDPEHIKIYMMTKLTEEEEQKYLKSIDGTVGQDEGSWVHPKLVPWTSDTDGIPDKDLLEYYKKNQRGGRIRVGILWLLRRPQERR